MKQDQQLEPRRVLLLLLRRYIHLETISDSRSLTQDQAGISQKNNSYLHSLTVSLHAASVRASFLGAGLRANTEYHRKTTVRYTARQSRVGVGLSTNGRPFVVGAAREQ